MGIKEIKNRWIFICPGISRLKVNFITLCLSAWTFNANVHKHHKVKVRILWEGRKILRNLQLRFDYSTHSQIKGRELYQKLYKRPKRSTFWNFEIQVCLKKPGIRWGLDSKSVLYCWGCKILEKSTYF